MKHYRLLVVTIIAGFLFFPMSVVGQEEKEEALSIAEEWLNLVDEGKYIESWEAAAAYFRGAVTKDQWEVSIKGVREPLGKVISRQVKSSEYTTELPSAPDGEYVVIRFDTSFGNKKSAIETVTPMKEKDGSWKVSGYYIR